MANIDKFGKPVGMDVSGVFKEITSLTEDELRDIHVVANRYNLARPPAEARL